MLRRLFSIIGVLTYGALLPARAADVPITNAGFEQPVLACAPSNSCTSTTVTGWTGTGSVFVIKPPTNLFATIPEGVNAARLASAATLSQTLTATLQQSTTYSLTYSVGRATGFNLAGYRVELLAGSTTLASDSSLTPVTAGTFVTGRIVFQSTTANPSLIGTPLGIRLTNNAGGDAYFDKISLDGTPNVFLSSASQLASGGGWKTALTLVNLTSVQNSVNLAFFGDGGQPLTLPVVVTPPIPGQAPSAASIAATLAPGATLLIESEGPASAPILVGWAEVTSSEPISGFAIFRQRGPDGRDSEGTAPADSSSTPALALPFDNTAGFLTGVALVNPTAAPVTVNATILDDAGIQIGVDAVALPPMGHLSVFFPDRFPITRGRRGIVQFRNTAGGPVRALGLRFSPFGSFTSIPVVFQ